MAEYFGDFLIGALSSAFCLVGIDLQRRAFISRKLRPIRTIWRLEKNRKPAVAVTGLSQKAGRYRRAMTGHGEMKALLCVEESLLHAYGISVADRWLFGANAGIIETNADVISIGGPKHNKATDGIRNLLPPLPLQFGMCDQEWVLVEGQPRDEGESQGKLYAAHMASREEISDYGLISRLPNRSKPGGVIFLIEGVHTYGLAAAGRMFTSQYARNLADNIRRSRCEFWQVVIAANVQGGEAFPRVERFVPLDHMFSGPKES